MADGKIIFETGLNPEGIEKGLDDVRHSTDGLKSSLWKIGKLVASVFSVAKLVQFGKSCIDLGSDLAEVQNVVDVTFGTMSDRVDEVARKMMYTAGLSETMAKQYIGTFGAMGKSFGFTEGQAYTMSTALTQLSGDVASFYNISQDEAFVKLKAVFTGETESLKDLGVVMTQTALDQYALSNGAGKVVQNMTEQEKVALRYKFILEKLSGASGDFMRTQDGWANQTRLLSLQFEQLKGTIGQGLINAFAPALRTINTLIAQLQTLAEVFRAVTAYIFGNANDDGGMGQVAGAVGEAAAGADGLADGLGAAGGAAKKLKRELAGFDEINRLSAPDTGGGGGGGGGGAELGEIEGLMDAFSAENIARKAEEIFNRIKPKIDWLIEHFEQIRHVVGTIGAALLAWKVSSSLANLLGTMMGGKLPGNLTVGITLGAVSMTVFVSSLVNSIKEGLDGVNFSELLLSGGGLVAAGALIGSQFGQTIGGAAIGGILAGVPMYFAGVYDAIQNGLNMLNGTLIPLGASMAGAGIGAIIGSLGGPFGAGIGALIGLAIGMITDFGLWLYKEWDTVAAWFDQNVSQPVSKVFSAMWESISGWASAAWENIKSFFAPATKWFSGTFDEIGQTVRDVFYNIGVIAHGISEIVKEAWHRMAGWFRETVTNPVSQFFCKMWESVTQGASAVKAGIQKVFGDVADWFAKTFGDAWKKVVNVFSDAGEIFVKIKDGVVHAFKGIVNRLIDGINSVVSVPFDGLNRALSSIRNVSILGLQPFSGIRSVHVPQIPHLAQGAVIPPNREFLAVLGDQRHGTNIEAPLETIQKAVALVMSDFIDSNMAGHEATVALLREILEAVLGIQIGDEVIGHAVERYRQKMAIVQGG